jgi:hypothetical protein
MPWADEYTPCTLVLTHSTDYGIPVMVLKPKNGIVLLWGIIKFTVILASESTVVSQPNFISWQ